jgi:chemotaxis protein histidine kinase CheA
MPDKKSDEVPKTTPDNWDVLQNLFLGRKQPTEEHPQLDNWDVVKSLFGISKSSPGNPTVDPVPNPKPPTNDIEVAKRAAEAAQRAAESAKFQAEMARTGAESAKTQAETAKTQAEAARTGAESAKTQAETARTGAESAKTQAETAKTQAETARTGAESAKTQAETARTGAESAKTQAETARTGAESAKTAAETARTGAQTAQRAAEIAKNQAENALNKPDLLDSPIKMEEVFKFLKKHRFKFLLAALGLIILLILLGSIFKRQKPLSPGNSTIYIDPVNGSDRNDGTNKAPFKTLPHALKQTNSGDIVHFFPGSYNTDIREDKPMVIPERVGIVIHPNSSRQLFSDIQNHWAAEFIEALAVKGIIKGFKDGKFRPDEPLTRAQYAAILSNAFDLPKAKTIKNFQDVESNFWAYQAIQKNYSHKFLQGFPNNRFYPNGKVQRVQVIAALVSGSALASRNDTRELLFYDDWKDIPEWAITQVATATPKHLIVNYPNPKRLNPTKNATRAEVAVMIYQSMVASGQLPPIKSIYIPHSAP